MNKLTVILITYNHSSYIQQALESVLCQRTDFNFEILIADDCSTDETLSIIRSAEDSLTNKQITFRYLEKTQNTGLVKNYQQAFAACNSEYIAILEGDDYWTNPNRLQRHVDFLDEHQECVMSFNNTFHLLQDTNEFIVNNKKIEKSVSYVTIRDLAEGNIIGNFSCCVYRKKALNQLNEDIFSMNIADWMVNLCVAKHGLIGKFSEVMSVYRIHSKGEWSNFDKISKLQLEYEAAEAYDIYFSRLYSSEFSRLKKSIKAEIDSLSGKRHFTKSTFKKYCPPLIWWAIRVIIPKRL